MRKSIKILSLVFALALIFICVSCKNDEKISNHLQEAKDKVNALSIPETVNGPFSDIKLYESDIDGITVTYTLSDNAAGYLKIDDYTLHFVNMPANQVEVTLTASITDGSQNDSVVFNILLEVDTTYKTYEVSVEAISGRKLSGSMIMFTLNGEEVVSGETNNEGLFQTTIEPNVYDVTVYLPQGFVFDSEDKTDTYTTKTDRNATPIVVNNVIPVLINEEAPTSKVYSQGDQMYDFTLNTYDPLSTVQSFDNTFNLAEELASNDLVVINFWYSTCYWCGQEFPALVKAYQSFLDAAKESKTEPRVKVIGITFTGYDNETSVRQAASEYGLNFELAISDEMVRLFNVGAFPTTVFIDRYGTADYIESGAITNVQRWTDLFNTYLDPNYVPQFKGSEENGGTPQVEPDVDFPESSVIEGILNKDGFVATYKPETNENDAKYSWPFVPSETQPEAIVPANSQVDNSYAIMYVDVELIAGQGFAFDYKASCEEDMDIMYLIFNGDILAEFSGEMEDYETFYPFVADKNGTYEFAFVYMKDQMASAGDDTVYLKNFRYIYPDTIPEPLFVIREASSDLDEGTGSYLTYIKAELNPEDGYYHVNDKNGPLLLADLMSATNFSNETLLSYAESEAFKGNIDGVSLNNLVIRYCQYAANSLTQGYTPVNQELADILMAISEEMGVSTDKEHEWLEMTVYFDVYGDTSGDARVDQETGEIIDPTLGLAHFNAYQIDVKDLTDGTYQIGEEVANEKFEMNRFITTRGFYFTFTPKLSGVYLIYGTSGNSNDCYVETDEYDQTISSYHVFAESNAEIRLYYQLANDDKYLVDFNLYAYFEAGKTYYVSPYPTNYGDYGAVDFAIEYLGDEYVVLEKASSFAYTTSEDFTGDTSDIESIIISGNNIEVALGSDGYYHQVYSDGTLSKDPILFDFVYENMLITTTFEKALQLALDPDNPNSSAFDMTVTAEGDSIIDEEGYLIEWSYTVNIETGETTKTSSRVMGEDGLPVKVDESVYKDYTSIVNEWYQNTMIKAEDSSAYGCIPVTEEVKNLLELLMNKYSFKDVEGSWLKLCYYYKYYGPSEHSSDVYSPSV